MTDTIPYWIREITADLFGLALIGPAFVLAFAHFILPIQKLDFASEKYPPPRYRLRVLIDALKQHFDMTGIGEYTKKFIQKWDQISHQQMPPLPLIEGLALGTIEEQNVVETLGERVRERLPENMTYTTTKYSEEVVELVTLANAMVPPAEVLSRDHCPTSTLPGILNAGWECYLSGLQEFSEGLPHNEKYTSYELSVKFNELLLKAMELNEIRLAWGSAQYATISEKNS